MKRLVNLIGMFLSAIFLLYLILPTPSFPQGLPNSPQSDEKGDSRDLKHQKAYFTDFKREEVMSHYQNELRNISVLGIKISVPTYRLNYPPEEGKQIIQEQIRTSYLEEIVHPFRESFYVNGFIPASEKDTIIINGRQFYEKVNVRYVYSSVIIRVALALASLTFFVLLTKNWIRLFKND